MRCRCYDDPPHLCKRPVMFGGRMLVLLFVLFFLACAWWMLAAEWKVWH